MAGTFTRNVTTLYNSAAAGNGEAEYLDGKYHPTLTFTVQVAVVNGADSLQLQGTLDNANWFNIGSAITTTQGVTVTTPAIAYRIVKTGTNGVATVYMY